MLDEIYIVEMGILVFILTLFLSVITAVTYSPLLNTTPEIGYQDLLPEVSTVPVLRV